MDRVRVWVKDVVKVTIRVRGIERVSVSGRVKLRSWFGGRVRLS